VSARNRFGNPQEPASGILRQVKGNMLALNLNAPAEQIGVSPHRPRWQIGWLHASFPSGRILCLIAETARTETVFFSAAGQLATALPGGEGWP
jgi:hypothetical protein